MGNSVFDAKKIFYAKAMHTLGERASKIASTIWGEQQRNTEGSEINAIGMVAIEAERLANGFYKLAEEVTKTWSEAELDIVATYQERMIEEALAEK